MAVDLGERLLAGNMRALARGISLVEENAPGAVELLRQAFAQTGRATVIGVTGSPGAGKSSLVDRLVTEFRKADRRVGVLAVDPSSTYSGGAILGDRIRMQRHHADRGVFIRSVATRGALGGLSRSAADMASMERRRLSCSSGSTAPCSRNGIATAQARSTAAVRADLRIAIDRLIEQSRLL